MKEILFIILNLVCSDKGYVEYGILQTYPLNDSTYFSSKMNHFTENMLPRQRYCHYESILFFSGGDYNRWLTQSECRECVLIDVKKGKQFKVEQEEKLKEVIVKELKNDGYKFEIKP